MSMSKITVKIEKDFTVIPNEIIRNKDMSANAKMILITMLSLPPEWDFSVNGLTSIVKEGKDTVRSALIEIEKFGYLTRKRERKADGTLKGVMYTVYQYPVDKNLRTYKPKEDKPKLEKPTLDKPIMDNQPQYNTELELNTNNNLESNELSKDALLNKEVHTPDKSDGEVHTSFSEKTTERAVTREDMLRKEKDMVRRFNNICDNNIDNPTINSGVKNGFEMYMQLYEIYFHKVHPILTDETLKKVCNALSTISDTEHGHFDVDDVYEVDDNGFTPLQRMISNHFTTNQRTNFSITHFANAEYLSKMANRFIDI